MSTLATNFIYAMSGLAIASCGMLVYQSFKLKQLTDFQRYQASLPNNRCCMTREQRAELDRLFERATGEKADAY
jgi:hypothetical protein